MEIFEVSQMSPEKVIVRGRGKNKKFWNVKEEAVLVDILMELNNTGWKTDSGYRNGYCYYVEKRLEDELPGCGLKADPHIESKIKSLRRQLAFILTVEEFGDDGFWWDEEQKMVVGSKEAFLTWAKNREGSSALFMKPFLHYDKLCEIFGRKRPTRKRARVPAEAIYIDAIATCRNSGNQTQSNVREDATSMTQSTMIPSSEAGNEKSKKSKKFDSSETESLEMSKTICSLVEAQKDFTLAVLDMKSASCHAQEISEKRKMLFSVLTNLPGLSPLDIVRAARSIGQDDRKVEVFFSMPDDYKVMFAHVEIDSCE